MTAEWRGREYAGLLYCDWHNSIRTNALDLSKEFLNTVWLQPLLLTIQLMGVAVTIAAVIGIVGAWGASSLEESGQIGRLATRAFLASMVLAITLPMILHAAAWEATAGKFGWLIMTQTGSRSAGGLPFGFFSGLLACGWIHGISGAALVAIACWYGTGRLPAAMIDQSRLELSPLAQWWQVRLPAAAPWWITALVATAILAATEMTVVDLYGFRTIADEFYLIYVANPTLASVLMTLVVPLGLLCSLLIWWSVSRRRLPGLTASPVAAHRGADGLSPAWRIAAWASTLAVAAIIVVVPIFGLIAKLGHEISIQNDLVIATWSMGAFCDRILAAPRVFSEEYQWTLLLAAVTASTALLITWPLASLSRTRPRLERWLDIVTISLVIIPGPVVAILVVRLFQWDLPGFRILYQQSIVPTVIALLARGIPVNYWLLRAAYRGIDSAILDRASLDAPWWRRVWQIDRPLLAKNLLAAFLVTAIVASGDVPATLPVIPPGVTTVGTRLFGLLHSGARYQEAALATWYVGSITLISLFLFQQRATDRVKLGG